MQMKRRKKCPTSTPTDKNSFSVNNTMEKLLWLDVDIKSLIQKMRALWPTDSIEEKNPTNSTEE